FLSAVKNISPDVLEGITTPDARKAYNMAREVAGDCNKTLSYIRLQLFKDRVLWGEVKPRHRVEDLALSFLRKRFPAFGILMKTQRGSFGVLPDGDCRHWPSEQKLDCVLSEMASLIPEKATWWEDKGDGLWDTFYNSQFISSRKNLPLFHKAMPKYYLDNFPGLWVEKRRVENGTLDEYMGGD
ncbi:MAG: DUF4130 domain-containing protein, partial [Candidatus Thermoplasmatota archaeon]|nr:DUF4130 domain-containing protein [Candidatus Thermoplasmatota archaeon]